MIRSALQTFDHVQLIAWQQPECFCVSDGTPSHTNHIIGSRQTRTATMKALIVDLARSATRICDTVLENSVQSVGATTGQEALAELERGPIDFLCFSMQLSDMTGLEFYAKAKDAGLIGKHPSVMLTSFLRT